MAIGHSSYLFSCHWSSYCGSSTNNIQAKDLC